MIIRVIDTESTGLPTREDPHAVVEVAYVDIQDGEIADFNSWLCWPNRSIDIEAMACHHITDAMVSDEGPFIRYAWILREGSTDYFAAHNAAFDRQFFDREFPDWDTPWICTMKVAHRLWPDAPSHTNQVLRYYLGVDVPPSIARLPPHRALPDAYVTALILVEAMQLAALDDMAEWSAQPSLLKNIRFGKHKGTAFANLPMDYLQWLTKQDDMDADVVFTALQALKKDAA